MGHPQIRGLKPAKPGKSLPQLKTTPIQRLRALQLSLAIHAKVLIHPGDRTLPPGNVDRDPSGQRPADRIIPTLLPEAETTLRSAEIEHGDPVGIRTEENGQLGGR